MLGYNWLIFVFVGQSIYLRLCSFGDTTLKNGNTCGLLMYSCIEYAQTHCFGPDRLFMDIILRLILRRLSAYV